MPLVVNKVGMHHPDQPHLVVTCSFSNGYLHVRTCTRCSGMLHACSLDAAHFQFSTSHRNVSVRVGEHVWQ